MQRTQSGDEISDSSVGSSNPLSNPLEGLNHGAPPRTLIEVLDDAIDEQANLRAALILLEYFDPAAFAPDANCLLCERAAAILAKTGRSSEAARIWAQVAKYWSHAGQPGRAIAAILHLQELGASFEAPLNEFSALYNIRSHYLDASARVRAVKAPRGAVSSELIAAKLQQFELVGDEAKAASDAHDQLLSRLLARALSAEGVMLEKPAEEASLPPLSLLSLLPANALRRVLELMELKKVARGEEALAAGVHPTGLFWTINQDFCIENDAVDADSGNNSKPARSRVPSGALLGLNSFGNSAETARFAVTSCTNGEILCLNKRAIETLDRELGDFLNRLTTLRRHALSEGFLESHSLFLQVERGQRADLMRKFRGVRVSDGEVLIEQGGASSGIYLVLDGQVDVVFSAHGQARTIDSLRAGDVFGVVSVVSNRSATARFVMASAGHVLFMSTAKFGEAAAEMPGVAKYAVKIANERIQMIEEMLEKAAR